MPAPLDPSADPRPRRRARPDAQRTAALAFGLGVLALGCGADDTGDGAGEGSPGDTATADGDPTDADPTDADAPGADAPDDGATGGTAGAPVEVERVESAPARITASGFDIRDTGEVPDDVPEPTVDLDRIRSGGPPPDGIPPIDEPVFLAVGDVDHLADDEPVLALDIDGDRRAYPVQILTWHEIVNDVVGGVPVTVTYCPLCNSAVAYERTLDGEIFDFGTSGLLYNSSLVMYDRQTETLWSHFTGAGVVGELTGVELTEIPLSTVAWSDFRDAYPDGIVLSRDTGFSRDYGRNPYPGYDDVDSTPFLFDGEVDGRYTAMTRMVGVEEDGDAVAVPLDRLREERTVATTVGTTDIAVFWTPGTASALDTADLAAGFDVGATGVFVPEAGGRSLTFAPSGDDAFVDDETGSTWNVFGTATDGPLAGTELTALPHVDTFWFAWAAFRPDTTVADT